MKKEIFLVGGGGHCHSCIDVIEQEGTYQIKGIVDKEEKNGQMVLGYEVIGTDKDIPQLVKKYKHALITLGQIKTPIVRQKVYASLKNAGAILPTVVSPRAYVSKHSNIGEGTVVLHDAVVNSNCTVGINCIINTKALCEHDSVVGDFCHISTGAIINGNCTIGEGSFVGSNAVLKETTELGENSIIPYGDKR